MSGAGVTPEGTWKAANLEVLPVRKGQLVLPMPTASAAIVSIFAKKFLNPYYG
jgi:hypothetical protein